MASQSPGSKRVKPQDAAEALAKLLAERVLGIELAKVPEGATKTPDFRPKDPAKPGVAIEVKLVSVQDRLRLQATMDSVRGFHPSRQLKAEWHVSVDLPTLDQRLPAHLPETIRTFGSLEDYAADKEPTVIANPDRTAQTISAPRLQTLARDLEPLLLSLEADGITRSRNPERYTPAVFALEQLLCGGIALAHPVMQGTGIEVVFGEGFSRSGGGNPLVARLNMYLGSDDAANLRDTLVEGVHPGEERHAFIVLDGAEPELLDKSWLPDQLPTVLPVLPPMIDRLWVGIAPELVMWHDRDAPRWSACRV